MVGTVQQASSDGFRRQTHILLREFWYWKPCGRNISTMTHNSFPWLRCWYWKPCGRNISTMGNCCESQQLPMVEMLVLEALRKKHLNHVMVEMFLPQGFQLKNSRNKIQSYVWRVHLPRAKFHSSYCPCNWDSHHHDFQKRCQVSQLPQIEKLWNKSFVSPRGNLLVSSCIESASVMSCSLMKKMSRSMTASLAACRCLTPAWFNWSKTVQSSRPQTFSPLLEPKQNGMQSGHNVTKVDCMNGGVRCFKRNKQYLEPNGKGILFISSKPRVSFVFFGFLVHKNPWPWKQHLPEIVRQPWPQVRNLAQVLDTMFPESDKLRVGAWWNKGKHGKDFLELRKS